jgi:hypothetical protein
MKDNRPRQYRTFDLRIFGAPQGQVYPLSVLDSPTGQCDAEFRAPCTAAELEDLTARVVEGRAGDEEVRAFGERLYLALFDAAVGQLWEASLGTEPGQGLRLRLRIDPPELQQLPWELLYDPRRQVYLSTDPATPVVRFLSLPLPVEVLEGSMPLRILVASASPRGLAAVGVEREQQLIQTALAPLIERGQVSLAFMPHATVSALSQAAREAIHVLHFIGHGALDGEGGTGWLLLEDEAGGLAAVTGAQLGDMLRGTGVRLAVLNACETARSTRDALIGVAPQLVASGLPAVIENQFPIRDQAAQAISQEFYAALADNLPVDAALAEARKIARAAADPSPAGWGAPVLFMRSPDGRIFDLAAPRRSGWAAVPAWTKWLAGLIAVLLVLMLGSTVLQNVQQMVPTPTPDRLPVITAPRTEGEYLVLVADLQGQGGVGRGAEDLQPAERDGGPGNRRRQAAGGLATGCGHQDPGGGTGVGAQE